MNATVEKEESGAATPSEQQRRALVERVAASVQFRRSARLRDFLLYVGRESLKDGHREMNEQEIGAKVFGRPPSYDRSQDNIVRVNATELRKRIDLYFQTEGADEPLILEIPRGGYRPVFHWRTPAAEPEAVKPLRLVHVAESPEDIVVPFPHRRRRQYAWTAAVLCLVALSAWLFLQNRALQRSASPWDRRPAVAAFWNAFLSGHQSTDVVLPDDGLSIIEDFVHHPVTLEEYISRDYMRQIQNSDMAPERKTDLFQIFSHNLTTFGSVHAGQQMISQLPLAPAPQLRLARFYTADAMKRNNVILVGGRKANPWVHLLDDRMNFTLDFDYRDAHSHAVILNQHPKPGEQAVYTSPADPNALTAYGVVAFLPNPSHTGNMILLAGMESDSTSAAAEFLASEAQLEHFRSLLQTKEFPYFEVLLKSSRVAGTSFDSEIVAYRTYPR